MSIRDTDLHLSLMDTDPDGHELSLLFFIIALEALSCKFRADIPWQDFYADELVINTDSFDECVRRPMAWKDALERKGLKVNAGKTNITICWTGLEFKQRSGRFLCAVCHTLV